MDGGHTPVIVIELLLVLGSVVAFAWWQLRDLDREREKRRRERAAREAGATTEKEQER